MTRPKDMATPAGHYLRETTARKSVNHTDKKELGLTSSAYSEPVQNKSQMPDVVRQAIMEQLAYENKQIVNTFQSPKIRTGSQAPQKTVHASLSTEQVKALHNLQAISL